MVSVTASHQSVPGPNPTATNTILNFFNFYIILILNFLLIFIRIKKQHSRLSRLEVQKIRDALIILMIVEYYVLLSERVLHG